MSIEFTYSVESPIKQEGIARILRHTENKQVVATWRLLSCGDCVAEFNIDVQAPLPQAIIDKALHLSRPPLLRRHSRCG